MGIMFDFGLLHPLINSPTHKFFLTTLFLLLRTTLLYSKCIFVKNLIILIKIVCWGLLHSKKVFPPQFFFWVWWNKNWDLWKLVKWWCNEVHLKCLKIFSWECQINSKKSFSPQLFFLCGEIKIGVGENRWNEVQLKCLKIFSWGCQLHSEQIFFHHNFFLVWWN